MFRYIIKERKKEKNSFRVNEEDLFGAMRGVFLKCRGGYTCTAMVAGYGIFGFRDPNGIRPLIYGKRVTASGCDYIIASESVVLDSLGFTVIADVKPGKFLYFLTKSFFNLIQSFSPGECVLFTKRGNFQKICVECPRHFPCLFEYVYFARPDSIIDGLFACLPLCLPACFSIFYCPCLYA